LPDCRLAIEPRGLATNTNRVDNEISFQAAGHDYFRNMKEANAEPLTKPKTETGRNEMEAGPTWGI
jgi:hypothetical protein